MGIGHRKVVVEDLPVSRWTVPTPWSYLLIRHGEEVINPSLWPDLGSPVPLLAQPS